MAFINKLLGRNLKTLGLLLTITLLSLRASHAQTFPVQANIHIAPPHSVYLSQYTSPEQEKVMVNILLRDPVITSLDVKFRFTIEGGGIKLTTNPAWNQQPFSLAGGIATTLSQELIAEHLKPQNLLIEGANPQEFFRSGKLPEGFYEFKVEVIEYRRGITISNIGRAGVWLTLSEAPRIVFPLAGQKVKATNPQMLSFTWIPGGASSPLSNLSTMYELTLVELPHKSIDPTVAITTASNASKYVKTLDQTSLLYGPSEMPLTPGKTYAFRVKAYNTQGNELFKNGGYSEVRTFTFGDACNPPVSFLLQNPKQSSFEINVYTDPSSTAWKSRFREKTGTEGEWSELKAEDGTSLKPIMGLKPTTTYEVQVKGLCGDIASDYTQTQTITTKPMVDANRSCTNNPTPFAVDNVASLAQLKKNDIFLAALFPIKVMDVKSQGGGKFSGRGIATLPLFNTGLAVTFENVGINQLMQLTSGEVKVVRDELNITLFGDTPTPPGGGGTGGSGGTTIVYPPINDTIVIPAVYDSLVVNNNTLIIYPPNGGAPVTVDLGGNACTLLVPADGNTDNAQIVYDGAAHPYHPGQGNINNDDPKSFTGLIAHFKPDNNSLLGFDTLKYSVLANYYKQLTVAGKQRYLPWKAIKDGTPELVNLRIKQGTDKMPFSSLKVKQIGMGDLTPSTGAGTQSQTYTLSGSYKGLEESVIAYYTADGKENYAGGLYIATYEQKKYKLFLVPLPGANIPDDAKGRLTNELSTIYSQAVGSWSVDILKDFKGVDLGDNGLDWANKDMLSSYNTEMNSVISAFKGWKPDVDPDAYYLFIAPKFSEGNVEGFMPRNRRFGFVTQSQLDGRTIAHELGHGAFNLKHTFSPSDWNIQQSTTDNLMDYAQGTKLWKPQWDFICNPEITTGLWDGMEEGAVIAGIYYWTPAGTPIKMTKTCATVINVQKIKSGEHINGILYSWEDGDKYYSAKIHDSKFFGYFVATTEKRGTEIVVTGLTEEKYNDVTDLKAKQVQTVNSIIYLGNCTKEDVITDYPVPEDINGTTYYLNGKPLLTSFPYTTGTTANRKTFSCSDISLQPGPGYDFYIYFVGKETNANKLKQIEELARIINQQGENGNTLYKDFVDKKKEEWKDITTFFCYTYEVKIDPNKQWELTLLEFKKYISDFETSLKTLQNTSSIELISQAVSSFSNDQLKAMRLDLRVRMLTHLSNSFLTDSKEWLCIRLIENINDSDVKGLVDKLIEVDKSGKSLLEVLDEGFADYLDLISLIDKYHRLAGATAKHFKKVYPFDVKQVMKLYGEKKYITWNEKLAHKYDTGIKGSKIEINGINYDPYEYVLLYSQKNYDHISIQTNTPCMVPAYIFHYLSHTRHIEKTRGTTINVTLNVISVASGIAALNAATKVGRILAVVDISVSAADIGVSLFDDAIRNKVGDNVVDAWGYLTIASGLANAGYDVYTKYADEIKSSAKTIVDKESEIVNAVKGAESEAAGKRVQEKIEDLKKELLVDDIVGGGLSWTSVIDKNIDDLVEQGKVPTGYQFYKGANGQNLIRQFDKTSGTVRLTIKDGKVIRYFLGENLTGLVRHAHSNLLEGGVKFVDDGNTIKYLTKDGSEFAKIEDGKLILLKADGKWPLPNEYLEASYITSHLSKFEGGVTKITSYSPSGIVGPPGGTFVLPKSQVDDLIEQAGGDVHKLEDLLGLNRGDLGDNPFRSDVINPSGLRMSTGNELGANEKWIPGGKTSGGILEATADSFQPGTYTICPILK